MKIYILIFFVQFTLQFTIHNHQKINGSKRKLDLGDAAVDVRAQANQKDSDNPLSELWDINHIRVARQKVNMNMKMPMNRVKMKLSSDYQVKIVVHSDEDFMTLQNYFFPDKKE